MSIQEFEALRAELRSLKKEISTYTQKTVRDDVLRIRFQDLFRTWAATVKPSIEPFISNKKEYFKLSNELEKLAQLTSKYKKVTEYNNRLNTAISLADTIILCLPPSDLQQVDKRRRRKSELFLAGIPDLPLELVPNSILGWRKDIDLFLTKYPFDNSVFIMIKYRDRNDELIKAIKKGLRKNDLNGIVAAEHNITDDLYNPIACLLACSKGIAVFDESETMQEFNPNVAYELGMLHLLGRTCLILKHDSLTSLHTDILMKLYKNYNSIIEAEKEITGWIKTFSDNNDNTG